jgi:hypothetical protein
MSATATRDVADDDTESKRELKKESLSQERQSLRKGTDGRSDGSDRSDNGRTGTAEAVQLPLMGTAGERLGRLVAGLDEEDRREVLAAVGAWLDVEHGARAVERGLGATATRAPGWLAGKRCPRAYVDACVAREMKAVAQEAAADAARQVRLRRMGLEVREREAARGAEWERQREEEARLRTAFEALGEAEREGLVAEAMAAAGIMRDVFEKDRGQPMEGLIGIHIRGRMKKDRPTRPQSASGGLEQGTAIPERGAEMGLT